MAEKGLGETAGEVLAQLPHEVADCCQGRFGLGQPRFSVITGCEFSEVSTLLPLAIESPKRAKRV